MQTSVPKLVKTSDVSAQVRKALGRELRNRFTTKDAFFIEL